MNSTESLNNYLKTYFGDLLLCKPLFYNSKIGIRFEIGNPEMGCSDKRYMKFVYIRSILLFEEMFSSDTEIYIVINAHRVGEDIPRENQVVDIFNEYLKQKDRLNEVECVKLPYCYQDEEDEGINTFRYSLACKVRDINYRGIIKAVANQDMGIKPCIYDEVYFVNRISNIIYHLYDDRGLDIIANESDSLRKLYEKYNDWILNYGRKVIDQIFLAK